MVIFLHDAMETVFFYSALIKYFAINLTFIHEAAQDVEADTLDAFAETEEITEEGCQDGKECQDQAENLDRRRIDLYQATCLFSKWVR